MSIEASLAACEETVRRADPDRYLTALFAPAERRPLLFALYAFNHELAHIGETAHEPMLADIRLEWWREAVEGAREGRPRAHDVVRALAELFARAGPPLELFETMIAARRFDVGPRNFADLAALEAYGDATSGSVMRIAAHLLDEYMHDDALFRHAGTAYALTGILRALPVFAARGKLYLPLALLEANGIAPADIRAGAVIARLPAVVGPIVERARAHYDAARSLPRPGHAFPAVMPAALVPLYAKRLLRKGGDILRDTSDVPLYRRQMAMLRAAITGHV
ncbi:MAG: phytoene/squalene synthase family protein [Rhizomicrobium sp.]